MKKKNEIQTFMDEMVPYLGHLLGLKKRKTTFGPSHMEINGLTKNTDEYPFRTSNLLVEHELPPLDIYPPHTYSSMKTKVKSANESK